MHVISSLFIAFYKLLSHCAGAAGGAAGALWLSLPPVAVRLSISLAWRRWQPGTTVQRPLFGREHNYIFGFACVCVFFCLSDCCKFQELSQALSLQLSASGAAVSGHELKTVPGTTRRTTVQSWSRWCVPSGGNCHMYVLCFIIWYYCYHDLCLIVWPLSRALERDHVTCGRRPSKSS